MKNFAVKVRIRLGVDCALIFSLISFLSIVIPVVGFERNASQSKNDILDLRERLTEREDENRVEEPWVVDLFHHPFSLNGQYEISLDYVDPHAFGDRMGQGSRVLLEQEVELEGFYVLAPSLSFFTQILLKMDEDLNSRTSDHVSDIYLERGEVWLYAEEIAGLPLSVEIGRINFEDDRLWWWDEDLDAVRLIFEVDDVEVALAGARELAPLRSDRGKIEPEDDDIFRLIAEVSWDWKPHHTIQIFALGHKDRSKTERPGEVVQISREDESDAELVWFGIRASGAFGVGDGGLLGYWFDAAGVEGDERLVQTKPVEDDLDAARGPEGFPLHHLEVDAVQSLNVRGWAFDVGITWLIPTIKEPRLTLGYAMGSGDRNQDSGTDKTFHQTGLHSNEPGFGGVQRFQGYGELLDPELSNISVLTAGIGCTLFGASSLDLVYHNYRLVEHSESLRDARLQTELTGEDRGIGQGIDVVLGLEEWDKIEFEFSVSAFRAGEAFGKERGDWSVGGFFAARFVF